MFPPHTATRLKVRTFHVPMFVVATALLGLIAVLATLQYRWLGRISAAERDRMTANLGAHSTALAQEFDQELTRAYATFQVEPVGNDENVAAKLGARYERWLASSRYPRVVRDVFVGRIEAGTPKLQRFSPATRFIEPVEWPETLRPVRDALAKHTAPPPEPRRDTPGTFVIRTLPAAVWDEIPALVIPMPVVLINTVESDVRPHQNVSLAAMTSFVIVHLDREYLTKEMLPALVEQRFRSAGTVYQVAVVTTDGNDVIYRSDPGFTPAPDVKADASAEMFQVRLQEFGALVSEIRRFTTMAVPKGAGSLEVHTMERPQRGEGAEGRGGPVSIMVQQSLGLRERSAIVSGAAAAVSRPMPNAPRWRLVVKHPSGSLEAAVNAARRRNLLVSSSVLALLGISVGFLIVTTRRAQMLARQQMEFVAAVSHELRTPLAVIRSAADNLAEGVVHDDTQVKKYGELMRGEGRRLSEMVEQILELAGIQSGQRSFALRPVPVLPLLHDVVRASSKLIDDAGIEVEYHIPETLPPVLGDEPALRRVFQNLLGNAIKYGASGRWVALTAQSSGREIAVTVADRGMGIPAAEQTRIFEPFYRAPNVAAEQIHGAGLGLSLVQRIVEAHGGRITVRSAEGNGSEFTVYLLAATEQSVGEASSVPDPAHRLP